MSSGTKTTRTRVFETIFIAPPTLGEAEVDGVVQEVQGHFENNGASIQRLERWGRRRMAYPIHKHPDGWYVLMQVEGPGEALSEVERRMRLSDKVIRFQSVRLDNVAGAMAYSEERVKRLAKQEEERKIREAERAAREAERAERLAREAERAEEKAAEEKAAEEKAAETAAQEATDGADAEAPDQTTGDEPTDGEE